MAVAQPLRKPRFPKSARFLAILLAVPILLLTACSDDNAASSDNDKIHVVTTLPLFADFVRNVGGDRVDVTSLLPLGADPHTFEPSPRDVEKVTHADIAFANGLDLEPGLIKVLEANLSDDAELVLMGDRVVEGYMNTSDTNPTFDPNFGDDPHLWLSPGLASEYMNSIAHGLASVDFDVSRQQGHDSMKYFLDRKSEYVTLQNREWVRYLEELLPTIPESNRKLVTAHEAFNHFAKAYQLEAVAAVADSPGQEPGAREIAELTEMLEEEHIPAVFIEPQIGEESNILRQAAYDALVKVCTLYSDSLDDKVSTYIEMMRFNADELARCLGGDNGN